eukprot:PhM_4_TR18432/c0_g1_i2/m.28892/K17584/PCIF1; phosphorylated CTD-interacting factor 1
MSKTFGFRCVAVPTEDAPKKRSGKFRRHHEARVVQPTPHSTPDAMLGSTVTLKEYHAHLLSSTSTSSSRAALCQEMVRLKAMTELNAEINRVVSSHKCDPRGLLPAFVFECMSAKDLKAVTNSTSDDNTTLLSFSDPLFPDPDLLGDRRCPKSVHDRCMTNLHDLRTMTKEQCEETAWTIAREVADVARQQKTSFVSKLSAATASAGEFVVTKHESSSPAPIVVLSLDVSCSFSHELLRTHYDKLVTLYKIFNSVPTAASEFDVDVDVRIFTMLTRYYALTGGVDSATAQRESGWHGSVPGAVLDSMATSLGVSCECFASPLNATMSLYFSAFPDTDVFFGSCGSFFDPAAPPITAGSYEANPPFDVTIAVAMAEKMCRSLSLSSSSSLLPLSFVIVMPYSDKGRPLPSTEEVMKVLGNYREFVSIERTLSAAETSYVDGYQQCAPEAHFLTYLDTRIFLLQNKKAKEMFPPESSVEPIVSAWLALRPQKRSRE